MDQEARQVCLEYLADRDLADGQVQLDREDQRDQKEVQVTAST